MGLLFLLSQKFHREGETVFEGGGFGYGIHFVNWGGIFFEKFELLRAEFVFENLSAFWYKAEQVFIFHIVLNVGFNRADIAIP